MKKLNIFFIIYILLAYSSSLFGQPVMEGIDQSDRSIGLYEKLEIFLKIDAEYKNPFDPDEIDIMGTFTSPSGKEWIVPGFYTQEKGYQTGANLRYGRGGFNLRFSANETGEWHYQVRATDKNGTAESETRTFIVDASEYHGHVRIALNKRYLEHADGTPWYGVGLWYLKPETEGLDELEDRGANFISWFTMPLETRGTGPGRYDQLLCVQIDQLLEELEKRDMKLSLNIWFHSFLADKVGSRWDVGWSTNAYQDVCDAKDFFSSEEAWAYQEKLYRYMIARWGYSRSLAIWNIVGEVHISDGWVSDRQGVAAWASKAHEYFKKYDPWQHLTTGTSSGQFTQWWSEGFEVFDLAAREIYESHGYPFNHTGQIDKDETHPLTYSYRNYHREIKKLWDNFEKPAVTGESGWDHTFYEPDMPGYLALYHNALWASLASGSAMSPFWWSYSNKLNDNVVTNQMLYFKRFADQVPFSKLTNISPLEIKNSEGDAYVMGSDQLIFGWAANADTDMSGKTITISDIGRGKYSLKLYHTWSGRFLENEDGSKEQIVESKGKLILFDIPVLKTKGHAQYVGKDIAFILKPLE